MLQPRANAMQEQARTFNHRLEGRLKGIAVWASPGIFTVCSSSILQPAWHSSIFARRLFSVTKSLCCVWSLAAFSTLALRQKCSAFIAYPSVSDTSLSILSHANVRQRESDCSSSTRTEVRRCQAMPIQTDGSTS